MAAAPPSRACSFLLLWLSTMQLVRFPTPDLMLHQQPVTQPDLAPTPPRDTARFYLISRLSAATPFLFIRLTAALVQKPMRSHTSILTSSPLPTPVYHPECFLFISFGTIYLCDAFWTAPMTGTDSKVSDPRSCTLDKVSSLPIGRNPYP